MNIKVTLIIVAVFICITGFCQTIPQKGNKKSSNHAMQSDLFTHGRDISVNEFLKALIVLDTNRISLSPLVIYDDFPKTWINEENIDSLMNLIESNIKCRCTMHPHSSTIYFDSSSLGGYAAILVDSYRKKVPFRFGLGRCARRNIEFENELWLWWRNRKGKVTAGNIGIGKSGLPTPK